MYSWMDEWYDFNSSVLEDSGWIILDENSSTYYDITESTGYDVILYSTLFHVIITLMFCAVLMWKIYSANVLSRTSHPGECRPDTYKLKHCINQPNATNDDNRQSSNNSVSQDNDLGTTNETASNKTLLQCECCTKSNHYSNEDTITQAYQVQDQFSSQHEIALCPHQVSNVSVPVACVCIVSVLVSQASTVVLIAPLLAYNALQEQWNFGQTSCNIWIAAKLTLSYLTHWSLCTMVMSRGFDMMNMQNIYMDKKYQRCWLIERLKNRAVWVVFPIIVSLILVSPVLFHLQTAMQAILFDKCMYSLDTSNTMYYSLTVFIIPISLQTITLCFMICIHIRVFRNIFTYTSPQTPSVESSHARGCTEVRTPESRVIEEHNDTHYQMNYLKHQIHNTYATSKHIHVTWLVIGLSILFLLVCSLPHHISMYQIIHCGEYFCVTSEIWTMLSCLNMFGGPLAMGMWIFDVGMWKRNCIKHSHVAQFCI